MRNKKHVDYYCKYLYQQCSNMNNLFLRLFHWFKESVFRLVSSFIKSDKNNTYMHRKRLLTNLFDGTKYDKRVRPKYDMSATVDVYLKLNLYQISEVVSNW